MEIKAKYKYDYKSVKSLMHFFAFGKKNPKTYYTISMILGAIAAVMLLVIGLVFGRGNKYWIWVGLDIFWLLAMNWLYFWLPKFTYRNLKSKDIENEFVFRESGISVSSINSNYRGKAEINYSDIPKITENSKYILVYLNKSPVCIVDKSTLEGGTAEELRALLSASINGKYITRRY